MNYKDALAIVQDFNMSKILAKKFSVPHSSGKFKKGVFELYLFHNVYQDINIYNYVDKLLRLRRMNILQQQILSGSLEATNVKKQQELEEI
jgi:hypothetical protein